MGGGVFSYFGVVNWMEYAKEVDITNDNDEYAVGDDSNNKPLAEGKDKDAVEYTSAVCCA
jgi:hypothetical protein